MKNGSTFTTSNKTKTQETMITSSSYFKTADVKNFLEQKYPHTVTFFDRKFKQEKAQSSDVQSFFKINFSSKLHQSAYRLLEANVIQFTPDLKN